MDFPPFTNPFNDNNLTNIPPISNNFIPVQQPVTNVWIVVYTNSIPVNPRTRSNSTNIPVNPINNLIYGMNSFSNVIGCYSSIEAANFQANINQGYQVMGPYPLVSHIPTTQFNR